MKVNRRISSEVNDTIWRNVNMTLVINSSKVGCCMPAIIEKIYNVY
jgi:hypothetical protein